MSPLYADRAISTVVERTVRVVMLLLLAAALPCASATGDLVDWGWQEATDSAAAGAAHAKDVYGPVVQELPEPVQTMLPSDPPATINNDPPATPANAQFGRALADAVGVSQSATAPDAESTQRNFGTLAWSDAPGLTTAGASLASRQPTQDGGTAAPQPLPAPLVGLTPAPAGDDTGWHAATGAVLGGQDWGGAVASGVGLALVAAVLVWTGRHMVGLGLFSRFNGATVLQHPMREQMWDAIRASPGIRVHELAAELGLEASLARHHVHLMERQGVIVSLDWRRGKHLFENHGRYRPEERLALAALQRPMMAKIARALVARPGVNQQELSAAVDAAPSLVHWHVTRLVEAGLVEKRREGRSMLHLPTPAACVMLDV